jgi:hypothetical protein
MKALMIAAAFISAIGIEVICMPSAANAQQRGRGSDTVVCPVGTCSPQGGQRARKVEACKPANCAKR